MRALVFALSILAAPTGALAQLPDPPVDPSARDVAEARDVFLLGMERARAEDWASALELFERSYRLSGSPVALFNLASTLRSMGRMRDAREAFDRLLSDPELDVETQRAAERMRAEVAARVARVTVAGVPAGAARVRLDAEPRRTALERPIVLDVDPGPHALEVAIDARPPWRWQGMVEDGARLALAASFESEPEAPPEESGGDDATPWIVLGAAAAVVVAAVVVGVVIDAEAQLDPRTPWTVELP